MRFGPSRRESVHSNANRSISRQVVPSKRESVHLKAPDSARDRVRGPYPPRVGPSDGAVNVDDDHLVVAGPREQPRRRDDLLVDPAPVTFRWLDLRLDGPFKWTDSR